jgi:hypothetical protein
VAETIERDFWAVRVSALPLLPAWLATPEYQSLTGGAIRSTQAPLLYADVEGLLLPGLAALGVSAALHPLPEEAEKVLPFLRGMALYHPAPVFAFAAEPLSLEDLLEAETERNIRVLPARRDRECRMIRQGVVTAAVRLPEPHLRWQNAEAEDQETGLEEFRARFTHTLHLRRATRKGTRRIHIREALRRWIVFAVAYPDRLSTREPFDAFPRSHAAAFLKQAAGQQRDAVSNRLRQAGERLEESHVAEALSLLREAVLREMNLPATVYDALLLADSISLNEVERRELIYLARAGTRDLRVLAAQRLAPERAFPDVLRTLEQLAYDPDPWVRAACGGDGVRE